MSNWIVVITSLISLVLGFSLGLSVAKKTNMEVLAQAQKSLDLALEAENKYRTLKEAVRLIVNSNKEKEEVVK